MFFPCTLLFFDVVMTTLVQAMFMREALRQMKEAQAQEIAALYEQVQIERDEAEARYSQLEQEYLKEKARADQLDVS